MPEERKQDEPYEENRSRNPYDGGVNNAIDFINRAADMVLLSIFWCVCSLPLVTLGASSAALYHSTVKVVRLDRARVHQAFFHSFKTSFKQSLPVTIVSWLAEAVFGTLLYLLHQSGNTLLSGVYSVFLFFCLLLAVLVQLHAYSLIGRFRLSTKELFNVVSKLAMKGFPQNLLCLFILACAVALSVWLPPFLFITPCFAALLLSYIEEPRFARYIRYRE